MYSVDIKGRRHSIAREKLLRAMPLQVFFSIRSERQLMEQTQYNLLFAGFRTGHGKHGLGANCFYDDP